MERLIYWLRESSFVRVIAGFLLAAFILAALGWLVTGPYKQFAATFDATIRYTMRQIQSPMWTALFLAVTRLGSTLYLIIIGVSAGILFIVLRRFRSLMLFIVAMAGQAILHHSCKWFYARPRPAALINYHAVESFSFPSGHTIASLCLYGMIAWIMTQRIENTAVKAAVSIFTIILVFLIGMSRVYIGVHNATDVLAGFLAGVIWIVAVMSADRRPL